MAHPRQAAQHPRRIFIVARLAEDLAVDHDRGVRAQNDPLGPAEAGPYEQLSSVGRRFSGADPHVGRRFSGAGLHVGRRFRGAGLHVVRRFSGAGLRPRGLVRREPPHVYRRRLARANRFVDGGGDDLELVPGGAQELSSTRRCGREDQAHVRIWS